MFQNSCKRSKIEFESASRTPFFEVAHFDAPTMSASKRNNKGYTIKDVNNKRTRSETTEEDRKRIISFLSNRLLEGNGPPKLIRGALSECASHFGRDVSTISRIWKKARMSYTHTQILSATPERKTGRGRKYTPDELRSALADLPINQRRNYRSMAANLGVSYSTLWRYCKKYPNDYNDTIIYTHRNALKPHLTPEHEVARVFYAREHLDDEGYFDDFQQYVHIDEKWWFLTEKDYKCYLTLDESHPRRTIGNQNSITKIMILSAIARPRFDENGTCTFDGKIGLWPIAEEAVAQRTSRNRPKGTKFLKPVTMDRDRYRKLLIKEVLPAIRRKFPREDRNVIIQQDGAKAHIRENDKKFLAAGARGTWNITVRTQPARSPDLNINDLAFFRALQSDYWELGFSKNVEEVVAKVKKAYNNYPAYSIEKSWLSLAGVLNQIIVHRGKNDFKLPHMGKDAHVNKFHELPQWFPASDEAIKIDEEYKKEEEKVELLELVKLLEEWDKEDTPDD